MPEPALLKKMLPAPAEILPPQAELELTLMKVAVVPELLFTTTPPLLAKAVPLGERRSPTIWLLPLSWRMAPGPIARFCH